MLTDTAGKQRSQDVNPGSLPLIPKISLPSILHPRSLTNIARYE